MLAALLASSVAAQETLFTLLEKNLDARGGYEAWKAVETVRMIGTMAGGEAGPVPVVMEIMRPNLLRFEFQLLGQQVVQGFDGTSGWRLLSDGVTATVEDMTAVQTAEFSRTADFEGPLLDWREKSYSLRYLGVDEGEDRCHLIEITRPGGEMLNVYLDKDTYLTTLEQVFASSEAAVPKVETRLTAYQTVDGRAVPFLFTISFPLTGTGQQLQLSTVELNVPLAEARFARPKIDDD
ncbi:MAG: hypothetical protein AAF358_22460 [Pseudomonadota bacterium]